MKLSKLFKESKTKNLTKRLGLEYFFKYGYMGYCIKCNKEKRLVKGYQFCSDCVLYQFNVKNNFISKTLFKITFNSLYYPTMFIIKLKDLLEEILDDIKQDQFLIILFLVMIFMIFMLITHILNVF